MKTIVTFTGIDSRTDIGRLCAMQKKYPEAEFGVLFSETRNGHENRYPDFKPLMQELDGRFLNIAVHVCGRQVEAIIKHGGLSYCDTINEELMYYTNKFVKRIQLNGVKHSLVSKHPFFAAPYSVEVIFQQSTTKPSLIERFDRLAGDISVLVDNSGGAGIESRFEPYRPGGHLWPEYRVGYAGGIGPDNVMRKLGEIALLRTSDWWIDMESRIRTDDWFDLDKVQSVLEQMFPGRG